MDISAPVGQVFDFVADYRNALCYLAHFHSFRPLNGRTYGLGAMVRASGRLHGIPISADLQIVAFERDRRLVSLSRRGVVSTSEWLFEPVQGATRVTFAAEYELPHVPVAGRVLGKVLEEEIRVGTRQTLERLKRFLEQPAAGGGGEESRGRIA